ncbi:MAG: malate synthase A [Streptosporangiales bacterium]|nr:malate synthase A [Streptosporangiales bacterium]MBO0890046.1 malate synthase A [Acidothermales bacterium]
MAGSGKIEVVGPSGERYEEILTPDALEFVAKLQGEFAERRHQLLTARAERRKQVAAGVDFDFREDTRHIREDMTWRVAPPAPGLVDRRVEITGPTEKKMTVNALNSGANVWLADFEDANSPTWANMVEGHLNLIDAIDRRIDFETPEGKAYRLGDQLATIVVRPRGWHLTEKHLQIGGEPVSGSLVDFGFYFFHCAKRQIDRGQGPYFYLPKLESHEEARLWNDVFVRAQELLGIPRGTIRATVLIETFPAAFEMEEILYELREHSAGLNAGRWDYIFSVIKYYRTRGRGFVLPDRAAVTMTVPFMRAYTELLVKTCHRRQAHAMGGMSAFIPSRRDAEVNAKALEQVRTDKEREAGDGFDGSWVAHPDLVSVVREVFDKVLGDRPNQVDKQREDVQVTAAQLLDVPATPGSVTEQGLRANIGVGLAYLESWLRGNGAAAINNLMEDAATAEISRSQVWQWLHEGVRLDDGRTVTRELVVGILDDEEATRSAAAGPANRFADARKLFEEVALSEEYPTFLTIPGYSRYLVDTQARRAFRALSS